MSDTIIGAIIGVCGTIFGVILAGPLAYHFSKILVRKTHEVDIDLMRKQEFNEAATEFRNAFLYELIFLKYNACIPGGERSYTDLHEFLQAGYIFRHLKAFEVFRSYLSAKERADIDKAWQKYCHHPDNPEILYFEQYSNKSTNSTQKREVDLKKLALERIEDIVKFAKHR